MSEEELAAYCAIVSASDQLLANGEDCAAAMLQVDIAMYELNAVLAEQPGDSSG